jgi:redox-sensitive bicupin YhaK (pirin superfamily)
MITKRPAAERGQADLGWLKTSYSFSFADYFDPAHMGYRTLRVLNDDVIAPGGGFGTHGHRDMEIVTYILSGALRHEDSQGNGAVLRAGDVQYMSAGRGILHSEFNASDSEPVHLFQLWILPSERGLDAAYEDRSFSLEERTDALQLIVSRDGREGSLRMNQAADIFAARLTAGATLEHELRPGRGAWIQVASGSLELNGVRLEPGDGAAMEEESLLALRAVEGCELLLIELG